MAGCRMSVRKPIAVDFPAAAAVLVESHGRSIYADRDTVDMIRLKQTFLDALHRHGQRNCGATYINVAERDGVIVGIIIGWLERVYHIGTKLMATDLFYVPSPACSDRDAITLFRNFEEWATENPAVIEIKLGLTNALGDYGRTEAMYLRMGYEPAGAMYEKRIAR